jgi:hypothetical protein
MELEWEIFHGVPWVAFSEKMPQLTTPNTPLFAMSTTP